MGAVRSLTDDEDFQGPRRLSLALRLHCFKPLDSVYTAPPGRELDPHSPTVLTLCLQGDQASSPQ